uniref:SP-RING-type domain-containing protein n=1 Tax=Caenorhabditis japonica TaxID=281687 RepID=A0A8R1I4S6_CAEJA
MNHQMGANNGLTPDQNQQAISAINKLKVHDLSSIISQLNIRRPRANKQEQQKALFNALFDPQTARTCWQMAVALSSGSYEVPRRGNQQTRAHPYVLPSQQRNGASNHLVSHHQQQQMQQHHNLLHQHQILHNFNSNPTMVQHLQQQQQSSRNIAPPPFEIVPLPFYDVVATLLNPVELHASANGQKQTKTQSFMFQLSADQSSKISYRSESTPLPRHEVQLRFFNITEVQGPQKDDFPLNAYVRLNEAVVTLPNVIPTNKANVEPKRPSRPVNLTPHMSRYGGQSARLNVEWLADKRVWACVVYYVHRVDSKILFNRVEQNSAKHKLIEETKREVIQKLTGGGEDDIAMDQLKISLLDPLIKTRMVTPSRCIDCTHLQCFDLMSYLMMNEKKPTWTCPVCSGYCPYNRLIVDDYFRDMLEKVDKSTTEVELKEDGTYDVVTIDDIECLSDDDEMDVKPKITNTVTSSTTNGSTPATAAPPPENGGKKKKPPVMDDDIIVLSDDDDDTDEANLHQAPAASSNSPKTPPPRVVAAPVAMKKSHNSNDIEIITLDDTPPRPITSSAAPSLRHLSQPTSSGCTSTVTATSSIGNLSDALAQIGNGNPPRSTPSTTQTSTVSSLPATSSSVSQQQHQMLHQQQQQFQLQLAAAQAATSQYGYPSVQQSIMHSHSSPQFQMQNGLIGRANQMAQNGQPQVLNSQYFNPNAGQQPMAGYYFPTAYQQQQQQQQQQYRPN